MKLLAPINCIDIIPFYHSLWIKEVYGWFIDTEIREIDPSMWLLNGRPTEEWNFDSLEHIQEAIDACRKVGIKFHITFNLLPYLWDDELLLKAVNNIKTLDFDSIILADINLLPYFEDKEIVISTLSNIYNSYHIEYLSKFNVKKIVLPRELSISEQKDIMDSFPTMEFELLILNDWCYNNDGTCSSIHFKYLPKGLEYSCKRDKYFYNTETPEITEKLQGLTLTRWDCKTCLMYFFSDYLDRVSFKIAGRTKTKHLLKKDILFAVQWYKQLEKWLDYNTYNTVNMSLYKKIYQQPCRSESCEMYNFCRTK